jgi:hypothetical protein
MGIPESGIRGKAMLRIRRIQNRKVNLNFFGGVLQPKNFFFCKVVSFIL